MEVAVPRPARALQRWLNQLSACLVFTSLFFVFVRPMERITEAMVRFRTIGDATCTGCVESAADTVDKVVAEVAAARVTERGATRADDRISEAGMEDRKKEGYF